MDYQEMWAEAFDKQILSSRDNEFIIYYNDEKLETDDIHGLIKKGGIPLDCEIRVGFWHCTYEEEMEYSNWQEFLDYVETILDDADNNNNKNLCEKVIESLTPILKQKFEVDSGVDWIKIKSDDFKTTLTIT